MLQAGRTKNAGGYRFGYQGQDDAHKEDYTVEGATVIFHYFFVQELNEKTIVHTPQGQLPEPIATPRSTSTDK